MLKSLLGGVGSFAGGLVDAFSNIGYNKRAKELAKYQYDLNMQAWREQTEYNKPINQVARLKEAGLNPQLAYGNGTQAGNASPTPQFQAPQLQRIQGFGSAAEAGINNAISLYMAKVNADNTKANTSLARSQASVAVAQAEKLAKEALLIGSKKTGQDIANELGAFNRQVMHDRYNREVDEYNSRMENLTADLQLKGAQIDLMSSQERYNIAQTITQQSLRNSLNAAANKYFAEAEAARQQGRLTSSIADLQEARNRWKDTISSLEVSELATKVDNLIKQGRATQIGNVINAWFEQRVFKGDSPYPAKTPTEYLSIKEYFINNMFEQLSNGEWPQ